MFTLVANSVLRIDQCHQESCDQVNSVSEMTVQRLLLELETGGNVRFEDGKPSDPWYKSCHDIVLSRFCVGDYQVYSFSFRLESALLQRRQQRERQKRNSFNKQNNFAYASRFFCTFLLLLTFTFCEGQRKVCQVSKRTRWLEIPGAFISLDFNPVRKRNYSLETTTCSWLVRN